MLSPGPNFWTETYRDRPFEAASWALQRKSMIQMELFGPRYDSVMNTRNYDVETKKTAWWLTYPSEKYMSSSVGVINFPIYGKS